MQPILCLDCEVAHTDAGTVRPVADLVVAEGRYEPDGKFVGHSIESISKRSERVLMRSADAITSSIEESLRAHVVEVGFQQVVSTRQGIGRWGQHWTGPPGLVQ